MIRRMLEQRKRVEIRWRDLDGFGHVNNAVFLTYLEECRDEFLRRHLRDPPERGEYMLVRVAIDYRSQITMADDFVEAEVGITRVGRSSVTLGERIFAGPGRRLAAEVEAVVVRYDWETGAARPIDAPLAAALAASTAETPAQAASAAASGESPSARPSE
ncbi:MAG: acyl-CoA thioester hydrolase [Gaiellales bacterium]|jgi:acyl-CoA thioester hydrolase|nr:acyl-CoA thioester hydrolase [Gaiellales bacterium]